MAAANFSETLVAICQTAQSHIPEDRSLHILTAFGVDSYMNICKGIRVTRENTVFV
jgi:hypothetical protein